MKAGFSIKLILYFAPNCPQQIVAPNCPTLNCPRRIVRAELSGHPFSLLSEVATENVKHINRPPYLSGHILREVYNCREWKKFKTSKHFKISCKKISHFHKISDPKI